MSESAREKAQTELSPTDEVRQEVNRVEALKARDEDAFVELFRHLHIPMLRIATIIVGNKQAAEDVVQEAWLGVVKGIDGFEERSSLRTWVFRILVNQARSHAAKAGRMILLSSLAQAAQAPAEPSVDPICFRPPIHPDPCRWAQAPAHWGRDPERQLLTKETLRVAQEAIDKLPDAQRLVIAFRDIEGCTAQEVCDLLCILEANHRVLLHRARAKVRRTLAKYWEKG